jgi:hypothetical protein
MDTSLQHRIAGLILKMEAVGLLRNLGILLKDYAVSKSVIPRSKLLTDGYKHSVVSAKLFTGSATVKKPTVKGTFSIQRGFQPLPMVLIDKS